MEEEEEDEVEVEFFFHDRRVKRENAEIANFFVFLSLSKFSLPARRSHHVRVDPLGVSPDGCRGQVWHDARRSRRRLLVRGRRARVAAAVNDDDADADAEDEEANCSLVRLAAVYSFRIGGNQTKRLRSLRLEDWDRGKEGREEEEVVSNPSFFFARTSGESSSPLSLKTKRRT